MRIAMRREVTCVWPRTTCSDTTWSVPSPSSGELFYYHINYFYISYNACRYKNDCYYHSYAKGDYNTTELLCAEKSSKVIMIKDRATYQFIRSWAIANGFHNFYLGYNYTTGDPATPVKVKLKYFHELNTEIFSVF